MKNLQDFLSLNESILDPIQGELNPKIWDKNKKLKKVVKVHLVKKLENWLKTKTSKPIKEIYLLGSNTSFQHTPLSDIDVNFVIDVTDEERKKIGKEIMADLNEKPLPGTKHPVNYFISNKFRKEWNGQSLYNISKDTWIKKPEKQKQNTVIGNFRAVTEISRFFIAGLELMISEYNSDVATYENYLEYASNVETKKDKKDLERLTNIKLQEIVADIDGIFIAKHMLHALRQEAFEKDEGLKINTKIDIRDNMNNSINNLIYKYVEKLGYFPKIKEILDESDKWTKKLQTG